MVDHALDLEHRLSARALLLEVQARAVRRWRLIACIRAVTIAAWLGLVLWQALLGLAQLSKLSLIFAWSARISLLSAVLYVGWSSRRAPAWSLAWVRRWIDHSTEAEGLLECALERLEEDSAADELTRVKAASHVQRAGAPSPQVSLRSLCFTALVTGWIIYDPPLTPERVAMSLSSRVTTGALRASAVPTQPAQRAQAQRSARSSNGRPQRALSDEPSRAQRGAQRRAQREAQRGGARALTQRTQVRPKASPKSAAVRREAASGERSSGSSTLESARSPAQREAKVGSMSAAMNKAAAAERARGEGGRSKGALTRRVLIQSTPRSAGSSAHEAEGRQSLEGEVNGQPFQAKVLEHPLFKAPLPRRSSQSVSSSARRLLRAIDPRGAQEARDEHPDEH